MLELKVLVVDDEPLARTGMLRLLDKLDGYVLCAECGNGLDAIQAISSHKPDLVLLDIEMPEMDGFEVVRQLDPECMPAIIFVTAYDQYAVAAFDAGAIDYVLKPVEPKRLAQALERARTRLEGTSNADTTRRLHELLAGMETSRQYLDRIVVRLAGRMQLVATKEIDWIESADNYVRIHAGKRDLLHREALSSVELRLDPTQFARVHRSTIVRIDRILQLVPQDRGDATLLLRGGQSISVSRRFRATLEARLEG